MRTSTKIWLILIFLIVLGTRLLFAFNTPTLDYEAYSILRQVDNIVATGTPLYNDELSYGGKTHVFIPLYHYTLAFFALFIPSFLVLKIIPNVFASFIVLFVFLLVNRSIKNEKISLIVAFISGLLPLFFIHTFNSASIMSVFVPLMLLTLYYFLETNINPSKIYVLILCMVLLTLLHPYSIILSFGLLAYLLLIKAQNFRESKREPEVVLFFFFFVTWLNIILYRRALKFHGSDALHGNLPEQLFNVQYAGFSLQSFIAGAGFLVVLFGLIGTYLYVVNNKRKTASLVTALSLVTLTFILFTLTRVDHGIIILSSFLVILAGYAINDYYEKSLNLKFRHFTKIFLGGVIILSALLFVPALMEAEARSTTNSPEESDLEAFAFIRENTPPEAVIITLPYEGSAMSYYAKRRNVMDDNYLFTSRINQRYRDVTSIYHDRLLIRFVGKSDYYGADYILVSSNNKIRNDYPGLRILPTACLEKIYPVEGEQRTYEPELYRIVCSPRGG